MEEDRMITRQRKILQALAVAGIAGLDLTACSADGGSTEDAAALIKHRLSK